MKRTKQVITNRRIMHRYQQKYKLWRHIISAFPLLRINICEKPWNTQDWMKYARQGIIIIDNKQQSTITIQK